MHWMWPLTGAIAFHALLFSLPVSLVDMPPADRPVQMRFSFAPEGTEGDVLPAGPVQKEKRVRPVISTTPLAHKPQIISPSLRRQRALELAPPVLPKERAEVPVENKTVQEAEAGEADVPTVRQLPRDSASKRPGPVPDLVGTTVKAGRNGITPGGTHRAAFGEPSGPRFKKSVAPRYPYRARRLGLEGTVVLELSLDASGELVSAKVIKSGGYGFDEAALEAVRASSFAPASRNGEPIACLATLPIRFQLRSR